jgi:hypothetical protein
MTGKVDIHDITRRALNGIDSEDSRHQAVLELFKTPERLERLEEYDQALLSLVQNPVVADALHRARYYDNVPLVQRTSALKIGEIVIELLNACADKFVADQVEHWGLQPHTGCEPEGAA